MSLKLRRGRRTKRPLRPINTLIAVVFWVALIAIIVYGGLLAWQYWQIHQEQEQAKNVDESNLVERQKSEGKDETKPTIDMLKNYKVAADHPRALYIDKLNVAARIMPMNLNPDNSIQAPINIYDSGWYTGSVKPGEPGAVFIDAHASGRTQEGLFGKLSTLTAGDAVSIERGDGKKYTYEVVHVETVSLANIDMKKALAPYQGVTKGLNLMTCAGDLITESNMRTLDHRVVVYTQQIN